MGRKIKILGWWIAPFLSLVSLSAPKSDFRLIEAVKNKDKEAARSLLKNHVDVNVSQADGATALAWAVYWDDLETADLLIRAGANLNAANDYGVTPLLLACDNHNSVMVEKLLKAGVNPNLGLATGRTALMTVARDGDAEVVNSLLEHGADVNAKELRRGQTALMWAVSAKHPQIAQVLIKQGADVNAGSRNGFTPLMFAARQGDLDSAQVLLQAGAKVNEVAPEEGSALVMASAAGREALAIFLLDHGANANQADSFGLTALHYAMRKGLAEIAALSNGPAQQSMPLLAEALMSRGANPNLAMVKSPCFTCSASGAKKMSMVGATPFFFAAAAGDAGLMRALLAKGADPKLGTNEGVTPLMVAAGFGRRRDRTEAEEKGALEAVKLMLELNSDVNATNGEGLTALHGAACTGANTIIQILAEKGARVNASSKIGETPMGMAEGIIPIGLAGKTTGDGCKSHSNTINLLLKLGANPVTRGSGVASGIASQ